MISEDAKRYELMVIINPDIGEDAIKKRIENLRGLITSAKGEIFYEEMWGLRDMTYTIKKHAKGYYVVLDFRLETEPLVEINRTLGLENEVLRHFIMVLPATYEPKDYTVVEEVAAETVSAKPEKTAEPIAKVAKKEVEPAPLVAPKKAKVEAKIAEKTEEEVSSKAPKKKEQTLEDVDAKLKSIIDNPDINF